MPIDRRRDALAFGELHRIQQPKHFIEISPAAHRVKQHGTNFLIRANDIDSADGGIVGCGSALGTARFVGGQHIVELGDLEVAVAHHGIVNLISAHLLDIGEPIAIILTAVDRQAENLGVALGKFLAEPGHVTKLGRANRSESLGMRKEDCPAVTHPIMEVNAALCGLSDEVGGCRANRKGHVDTPIYLVGTQGTLLAML